MKKILLIVLIFIMILPSVYAREGESLTIATGFKTTVLEDGLYNIDGNIYVPFVELCEAMGSIIYRYPEYNNYYVISREGDICSHSLYYDSFEFNGENITVGIPSTHDDKYEILVPFDLADKMYDLEIEYTDGEARIKKEMYTGYYNNLVSRLLQYSIYDDFYPEKFKRYYNFYGNNPDMDAGTVINSVNLNMDKAWCTDESIVTNPQDYLTLVNKYNRLPYDYNAANLERVGNLYKKFSYSDYCLDREVYYKYVDMYDAAASDGLSIKIVSAYRTEDYQRNLYSRYKSSYGKEYADRYSAKPGYSEHQTGFAVDINSLYTSFENSAEYAWLSENAHRFGFIERYKKGAEYITGYAYEPWHYRYVGVDAATEIHEKNITLEEYYATYIYKSNYKLDKDRTWMEVIRYYHLEA